MYESSIHICMSKRKEGDKICKNESKKKKTFFLIIEESNDDEEEEKRKNIKTLWFTIAIGNNISDTDEGTILNVLS